MPAARSPSEPLDIAIIGGSLAGLLHGVALSRLGHNVTILERSTTSIPENQGAGLAAAADLQLFMSTYDLTGLPYGVTSPDFRMVNSKGDIVRKMGIEQVFSSWECVYHRLRANFDGLVSEYVPNPPAKEKRDEEGGGAGRYEFGKTVTGLREEEKGVVVEYTDQSGLQSSLNVDLVVAADGPSSTRGTIPKSEVSEKTKEFFGDLVTFCKIEKSYLISYAIPGKKGEMELGRRLRNWVWYRLYPEGSASHKDVMTARDGYQHRITVPMGKVRDETWTRQKALAEELLDPYSAELVTKTAEPFIQALTDVVSPKATFLNGKVLLVGDALATFRPTTGQSTNQAARNAIDMRKWLEGAITLEEWERRSLEYARTTQQLGIERAKGFGLVE